MTPSEREAAMSAVKHHDALVSALTSLLDRRVTPGQYDAALYASAKLLEKINHDK